MEMIRSGPSHIDRASFSVDDESAVVMATFACRGCLRAAQLVVIGGSPGDRTAASHCMHCGFGNHVLLTDEQTYQLWTLQRGSTFIHFAPELW
jgi:hypothetical protein